MKKCTYCGKEYPDNASVCAIDQEPLESDSPPAGEASTAATANGEEVVNTEETLEVPEGYRPLGSLDSFEAARLLRRFEEAGIRFLIDQVERALETGRGLRQQVLIEIYVHCDDEERASKILTEDWKL